MCSQAWAGSAWHSREEESSENGHMNSHWQLQKKTFHAPQAYILHVVTSKKLCMKVLPPHKDPFKLYLSHFHGLKVPCS